MRCVVLLSGGLDSTVLLTRLVKTKFHVVALSADYGQKHRVELEAAAAVCDHLDVEHIVADLTGLKPLLQGSALTEDSIEVPDGHYEDESMKATVVPNRNMLLLSAAASLCVSRGFDSIAYAAHAGDHAIYPDCRREFIRAMANCLILCDYKPIALMTPFDSLMKWDIVREGDWCLAPMGLTWSCYKGGEKHCGTCGTCVERKEAFLRADVADPTEYLA